MSIADWKETDRLLNEGKLEDMLMLCPSLGQFTHKMMQPECSVTTRNVAENYRAAEQARYDADPAAYLADLEQRGKRKRVANSTVAEFMSSLTEETN